MIFLEPGVPEVARHQVLDAGDVELGRMPLGHFFQLRFELQPRGFDGAVFGGQLVDHDLDPVALLALDGTGQHRREQLAFLLRMVFEDRGTEKAKRLFRDFARARGGRQQRRQLAEVIQVADDALVAVGEIQQRRVCGFVDGMDGLEAHGGYLCKFVSGRESCPDRLGRINIANPHRTRECKPAVS
ncbi:MAG: hypothetical protein IPK05_15605 [Comamonadaceae bacterium]|nr:hypothetical protein [Comamonadaceae bacterium]